MELQLGFELMLQAFSVEDFAPPVHSYLKAFTGSTRQARRAGKRAAIKAVITKVKAAPAIVHGSCLETPKRTVSINRVNVNAAARPAAIPATAGISESLTIGRITADLCAPSATRIPISVVRHLTVYVIMPKIPIQEMRSASNP